MAQEGLWNIAKKKRMFEDRGALPREDGDLPREYQATHEENFLSTWLREGVEGQEMERREAEQGSQKKRKEKVEKREVEEERKGRDQKNLIGFDWIVCLERFSRSSGKVFGC